MIEIIPSYAAVSPEERGANFNLSFEDWRMLARTALSVTSDCMGIYAMPASKGCAVDIFTANKLLTIQINSKAQQIALLTVHLDSIADAACLLSVENSSEGWQRLGQVARKEISKHD